MSGSFGLKLFTLVSSEEDQIFTLVSSEEDQIFTLVSSEEDQIFTLVSSEEVKIFTLVSSGEVQLFTLVSSEEVHQYFSGQDPDREACQRRSSGSFSQAIFRNQTEQRDLVPHEG
jgi:hypothetical protein